jgi:putative ABC transport system permease protein
VLAAIYVADFAGPVFTAVTALLMLLGFAIPSLCACFRCVAAARVACGCGACLWSGAALTGVAWLALFAFVLLQTGKLALSVSLIVGLAVLLVLMFGLIYGVLVTLKRMVVVTKALVRQPVASGGVVVVTGQVLVGVVLLLRGDLLNRWQQNLPVIFESLVYGLHQTTFTAALAEKNYPLYAAVSDGAWSPDPD